MHFKDDNHLLNEMKKSVSRLARVNKARKMIHEVQSLFQEVEDSFSDPGKDMKELRDARESAYQALRFLYDSANVAVHYDPIVKKLHSQES